MHFFARKRYNPKIKNIDDDRCLMIDLIIADDFTGSNDAGVQLVNKGMTVNVFFDWQNADFCEKQSDDVKSPNSVMVVNTESRATSIQEAQKRIKTVINNHKKMQQCYKKIDSTLRGNIGAEIEALLDNTQYKVALVIPAFPKMKRTTKNGKCYINGIELINTEFASDPKTPIYSSNIKACIEQQTAYLCEEIYLATVRNQKLKQHIEALISKNCKIIVIDAENDQDLQSILEQISPIQKQVLLVGSAGLIDFFPLAPKQQTKTLKPTNKNPLLVIAGSMSEVTQQQINYIIKQDNNWKIIDIVITDLLPNFPEIKLSTYIKQIQQVLDRQQHCIVRTSSNMTDRHKIEQYCQQYQVTRTELGEQICQALGLLVNHLQFDNLFLTGGDVAISVAKSLGAIGFRIEGEVSVGVPYGKLISEKNLDYRVFTKAGGFGTQDIFLKILAFI